ncbi:MAG: hypothetical protein ABL963_12235 [Longimicrobiales bacterium]
MTDDLPRIWRGRADELRPYAPAAAEAFTRAAVELEESLHADGAEELTLAEAAQESRYAARTLREKLAKGELPNAGARHRPRIRRADLPRRAGAAQGGWDASAHVADIVGRVS